MTKKSFTTWKWSGLILFALMYNFVYLGRFNVNNLMGHFAEELVITTEMQQELIAISVFISYAVGSFFNGYLADRLGAKKVIVCGGLMTILMNLLVSLAQNWILLLALWLINGYFQSMIWVGGISFLSQWWGEGERGKGIGIANFFSGMSHATAYLIPVLLLSFWPMLNWRMNFVLPMAILLVFVLLFAVFAKERPEAVGLQPYEVSGKRELRREKMLRQLQREKCTPWRIFFRQPKFWWWCAIAMLSSICRYGLLNWIPLYYETYRSSRLLSESFSNLTLPIGMAVGTLMITWVAGTKLLYNKGIIVTAMAAICASLVVIFPMVDHTQSVLVGIFCTGFVLYGINGILWLYAIDQGCRCFAGSAAGILNGFAYLGACMERILFPLALHLFQSYLSVFIVMEVLFICMVICGMVVSEKNTTIVPEVRD